MINQSARITQIIIGGQDWSNALLDVSNWSSNGLNDSGLIKITATIRLINVEGMLGSLDDRKNNHWRAGQPIIISVPKSDGTMHVHPAGRLRIISAEYEEESGALTINAGCLITLLSYRQPVDDAKVQPEPTALTARNKIVSNLLSAAGITNVSNPWTLPNPLYFVQPAGSYLETCGKVLYSCGYFGYINSNETFCVKPINLVTNGVFTLKIGGDDGQELWYRRLKGAEGPREVVKVTGTAKCKQPDAFPKSDSITRYGDASQVDPTKTGLIVTLFQKTIEDFNGSTRTLEIESYAPLGLLIPFLAKNYGSLNLSFSDYRKETKQYEPEGQPNEPDEGKLTSTYVEATKLRGVENAEYWQYREEKNAADPDLGNAASPFLAEVSSTKYFYDSKNRPKSIETIREESEGKLLSGISQDWRIWDGNPIVGDPINLKLAEVSQEEWKEQGANEWAHTTESLKTLAQIKASVASAEPPEIPGAPPPTPAEKTAAEVKKLQKKLSLVADDSASIREVSNSGQTTPPAPERRPPKAGFQDEQVKGEANFAVAGGNPFKERERTFQIDYLEGGIIFGGSPKVDGAIAQCNKMAALEGQLLFGRHKGQDIGTNLRDEFFDWQPLMRINCKEPDGTVRAYALDDSHWSLAGDRALCNFSCLWVGDVGGSSLPVTVKVGGSTVKVTVD